MLCDAESSHVALLRPTIIKETNKVNSIMDEAF